MHGYDSFFDSIQLSFRKFAIRKNGNRLAALRQIFELKIPNVFPPQPTFYKIVYTHYKGQGIILVYNQSYLQIRWVSGIPTQIYLPYLVS